MNRFIEFFKKEFGPYFRDFGEYDFKFFRTLRDALVKPEQVIEANDGRYTGELKYALNMFTVLFVITYFMEPSWIADLSKEKFWEFPLNYQEVLRTEQSIAEDYEGFVFAGVWIPIYFVLLKLFFYRRRPWGYFLSASFYLTPLIFSGVILLGILLQFIDLPGELTPPIISFLIVWPIIRLKLNHWAWNVVKGIMVAAFTGLFSYMLVTPLNSVLIYAFNRDHESYEVKSIDPTQSNHQLVQDGNNAPHLNQVIMTNAKDFFYSGSWEIGRVVNGKELWFRNYPEYTESKMLHDSRNDLLIFFAQRGDSSFVELFDSLGDNAGKILLPKQDLKTVNLIGSSTNEILIHFNNGKSNVLKAVRKGNAWDLKLDSVLTFSDDLVQIQPLNKNDYLAVYFSEPLSHIATIRLERLDSLFQPKWGTNVYQKYSSYNPHLGIKVAIDTAKSELYTSYNLANDSTMVTYIQKLDLLTGEIIWQSDFSLPANITSFYTLRFDAHQLFLGGVSHKTVKASPFDPNFGIGVLARINRENGALNNYLFTGHDDADGALSQIFDVYPKGDSLYVVSFDGYYDTFWSQLSDQKELFIKVFPTSFE